ncbi:pyrroline-5-carboxylate reductase [Rikenella microfusus]|uniref:Pyrroline-5-carboxylate reductase n=1 Tax=Rikenella microfusus TaxID=28139 RepID=A0A379MN33_9BACT|nr:pyrroline-5-carboxylate reductase [Rikenella microfusus]SUE33018.1 Pyrroline-5-carboxylate reductase [Rikenella microfusus]HJE88238.1 pyrroline-5-carboxylate reductase [Rikenella microfusus]
MKVTVIGAGNMGGAMIRGLVAGGRVAAGDITAVAVHDKTLNAMREVGVQATTDAVAAAKTADVVLLAVKPWLVEGTARQIAGAVKDSALIGSVAAGIGLADLVSYFGGDKPLFRIMPNTAVTVGESMTFVTAGGATPEQTRTMISLFEPLGKVMEVPEKQFDGCMALASCGIAYALRYVRAAMEGGIELGIPPQMAQTVVAQTLKGAAEILLRTGNHPEAEIDKVTTPGGITIKGLNAMEANGFTRAVIEGLKASK